MAKATIRTPQGIQVNVEGTPAEIAAVVKDLEGKDAPKDGRKPRKPASGKATLQDLIDSLIDGGFFKKPRDLASIKGALAEMGHHYPQTTLSPTMLRKVRSRSIRRIRDQKRWMYVQ
jgi:hypothetical protein